MQTGVKILWQRLKKKKLAWDLCKNITDFCCAALKPRSSVIHFTERLKTGLLRAAIDPNFTEGCADSSIRHKWGQLPSWRKRIIKEMKLCPLVSCTKLNEPLIQQELNNWQLLLFFNFYEQDIESSSRSNLVSFGMFPQCNFWKYLLKLSNQGYCAFKCIWK